jgi:hypothetical protein
MMAITLMSMMMAKTITTTSVDPDSSSTSDFACGRSR